MPDAMVRSEPGAASPGGGRGGYRWGGRGEGTKPAANFLMLNPSTADEVKLDPSCTRARVYAEQWGFGALIVTNLFGWRATDPDDMKAANDPVGRGKERAIVEAARHGKPLVCALGNHGLHRDRAAWV